jgi:hypothetical protein
MEKSDARTCDKVGPGITARPQNVIAASDPYFRSKVATVKVVEPMVAFTV